MTPRQRDIMDAIDMLSAMQPAPTDAELVYLLNQKVPGVSSAEAEDAFRAPLPGVCCTCWITGCDRPPGCRLAAARLPPGAC